MKEAMRRTQLRFPGVAQLIYYGTVSEARSFTNCSKGPTPTIGLRYNIEESLVGPLTTTPRTVTRAIGRIAAVMKNHRTSDHPWWRRLR